MTSTAQKLRAEIVALKEDIARLVVDETKAESEVRDRERDVNSAQQALDEARKKE